MNVKTHGDILGGLDIGVHPCDYMLVLTRPPRGGLARVRHHRWQITAVYLFEMTKLLAVLSERGVKGIATSLRKADAEAARIFPQRDQSPLQLSTDQIGLLRLFSGADPATS